VTFLKDVFPIIVLTIEYKDAASPVTPSRTLFLISFEKETIASSLLISTDKTLVCGSTTSFKLSDSGPETSSSMSLFIFS